MKKRIKIICVCLLASTFLSSCSSYYYTYSNKAFKSTKCIDGIWGEWERNRSAEIKFLNNKEFIIYMRDYHPSKYWMRVVCDLSTEKIDDDGWYRYAGTVEYVLYLGEFCDHSQGGVPRTKCENAIIATANNRFSELASGERSGTINLWFDGFAYGIANTYTESEYYDRLLNNAL